MIILLILSVICAVEGVYLLLNAYKERIKTKGTHITAFVGLLLLVIGICFIPSTFQEFMDKSNSKIEISDDDIIREAKELVAFEDSVFDYIKFLNIKHPEIVLKQAKIESGNFKSKVFRENNNMFGMKVPYKRSNIVSGENLGYAVYNTWQESVIDYALYQTYSAKGMTKEQYIQHLGNSYAEDPNYKQKVK